MGRVNLVGADHVSVLVFNMFNVAIGRDNIRPDLRFVDTVRSTTAHPVLPLGRALRHSTMGLTSRKRHPYRQAFGGEDRARVESARHRGHVITSGVDVAFTVVGCVDDAVCALHRWTSLAEVPPFTPCHSITDVDDLLSMTGAMLTDDTGR